MTLSLVVISDGRLEYLHQCVESFKHLPMELFEDRIVVNDSASNGSADYYKKLFPEWRIISHAERRGLTGSVNSAWDAANGEYLFHVEEDFVFNRPVEIDAMRWVLDKHFELAQICLLRQPSPYSPAELAAGGIVEMEPSAYTPALGTSQRVPLPATP
jgi:glycosyltransferase involved in cell wall biosynthesis